MQPTHGESAVEHSDGPVAAFEFFHPLSRTQNWGTCPPAPLGFFALELETAGACRAGIYSNPTAVYKPPPALGLRPRRALSSDGDPQPIKGSFPNKRLRQKSTFDRTSS